VRSCGNILTNGSQVARYSVVIQDHQVLYQTYELAFSFPVLSFFFFERETFRAVVSRTKASRFPNPLIGYPEMVDKLILLNAVSMPPNPNDKDPFLIKIVHLIQRSDYTYWLFTRVFESQILSLMGIPSDDFKAFTSQQKALAREMLDVMHPMSPRYNGTRTFKTRKL